MWGKSPPSFIKRCGGGAAAVRDRHASIAAFCNPGPLVFVPSYRWVHDAALFAPQSRKNSLPLDKESHSACPYVMLTLPVPCYCRTRRSRSSSSRRRRMRWRRRKEGQHVCKSACLVQPLKWQCDQLCLESQPLFVPPPKASGGRAS